MISSTLDPLRQSVLGLAAQSEASAVTGHPLVHAAAGTQTPAISTSGFSGLLENQSSGGASIEPAKPSSTVINVSPEWDFESIFAAGNVRSGGSVDAVPLAPMHTGGDSAEAGGSGLTNHAANDAAGTATVNQGGGGGGGGSASAGNNNPGGTIPGQGGVTPPARAELTTPSQAPTKVQTPGASKMASPDTGGGGVNPLGLTGGGSASVPDYLPTQYASTAVDPQREIVQVNQNGQALDPMAQAFSAAGVRYVDGTIQVTESDLSSPGFGNPWGQIIEWSNGIGYADMDVVGAGWVDSEIPYLHSQNGGNTTALITSGTNSVSFTLSGSTWTVQNFLQDTLTDNTTTHTMTVVDDTGKVMNFYDFSSSLPAGERGMFQSITDQFGDTLSVTSYTSTYNIQEIQSSNTVGSTTITVSFLYSYNSSDLLSSVVERQKTNSGAWSTIRQVAYTYYGSGSSYGVAGDLELGVVEDGSGNTLETNYYRYYTASSSIGYASGLEYVFDNAAYERLAAAYSNPLTATNTQVAPYAELALQYNGSEQVSQAVVAGDGSSLASSNVGLGTYSFTYTTSSNSPGSNSWDVKTVETLPDSSTNTVFTNAYGEVMLRDFHDSVSGSDWDYFTEFDSAGRPILTAQPSAVTGYSSTYSDLLHKTSGNYQYLSNSAGLLLLTAYYTSTTATGTSAGGVTGDIEESEVEQGQTGTAVETEAYQYYNYSATVSGTTITVDPVATDEVFSGTGGTGGRTTSYSYTWFSSSTVEQSETVTYPVVSSGQNGPGTADTETTYFNTLALPIWKMDGDGFLTYLAYDQATSAVVKQIDDVNTADTGDFSNLPTGWTTPSGGGLELITTYQVDSLGRTTEETDPNGNVTYTVFNDPNQSYRVYPGWNSGTGLPTGPTQVYREDLSGSYSETLTMTATPHLTGGVPDGTESIGSIQTLSRVYVNSAGQAIRKNDYFYLSGVTYSTSAYIGTQNTNYYTSLEDYDNQGLLTRTETPTATITRTVHDSQGRVISIWVGTDDTPSSGSWSPSNNTSPANMVETVAYQYDGGAVGDGDMTQETDYPGGSAANRVTDNFFDWRDRLVASKQGVQTTEGTTTYRPIIYNTFDNLNEITEVERFDGDGVTITSTGGVPNAPSSSLLRAETVSNFDNRGRVYQTIVYDVNQSSGAVSSTGLTTNDYFNDRGELIEDSEPGGLVMKYQFDGAGRQIESYTTDGAGGTSWSAASSVSSDNVLEQTDTTYDSDGNVILTAQRERDHNDTATGALGNVTTSPEARIYYTASYFDAVNRIVDSVNVGDDGGSTYTRPGTAPSSSATVLVTGYSYNSAGWLQATTDPRGIVTEDSYNNLGELTQEVQDYTGGSITATTNKTTNYTYDGSGHMLTLQAMEVGGGSETTQWNYGVSTGTGSDINSNDILSSVEYPDPSTGSPSTSYEELYTVDALGDNLTNKDRAGNVHTYTYDVLGRLTSDAITTLASGFDNSVLDVQTAYNALGDAYTITNLNAASGGTIVNQVEDVYNGLNQLTQEYQSHSGAVNTSTSPSVQYTYSELASGNNSRLETVTYPDSYTVTYNYGTGIDNTISRLTSISDTTGTLEAYLYLDLNTVVQRTRPQINEEMTLISQTSSTGDGGDQYTGLDRFGRIVEVNWYNTSTSTSTDDFQYGYDQDSNVLYKNNILDSVFSELYHTSGSGNGYDNLNQLSAFARGTLSASGGSGTPLDTVSSPTETESWSYDALGNFSSVTLNGTPMSRTNNQQNETTAVGSAGLTFDANGNTLVDDQGLHYTFDAWNRAVSVSSGGTTIASYEYDGLGRRVQQTESSTTTDIYFDSNWQDIEEQVSGTTQARYVWSPIDQDAMVLRDDQPSGGSLTRRIWVQQDANWNVTSIVNSSGSVVERYVYDPYGAVTYLTASWGSLSASAYGWQYLFQAGRLDAKSGEYIFQHRDFSATLGRWSEIDPLKYNAEDNDLYRFLANQPSEACDPQGMSPTLVLAAGGAVIGGAAGFVIGGFYGPYGWGGWDWKRAWKGGAVGVISGAVTGLTLGLAGPGIAAGLGGGALGGTVAGGVSSGVGNLTGQGFGYIIGYQDGFDGIGFGGSIIAGGIGGGIMFRGGTLPAQPVTTWGPPGNGNIGPWVMTGGPSFRNWIFAGGPSLIGTEPTTVTLPSGSLFYPEGWEAVKGFLGQRIVVLPPEF